MLMCGHCLSSDTKGVDHVRKGAAGILFGAGVGLFAGLLATDAPPKLRLKA
jgi:hypothetical protein